MKCEWCTQPIDSETATWTTVLLNVSFSDPTGSKMMTFDTVACVVHWIAANDEEGLAEIEMIGQA